LQGPGQGQRLYCQGQGPGLESLAQDKDCRLHLIAKQVVDTT